MDVELWPWGMDRGQGCKRLEISTSSDPLPSQIFGRGHNQAQQKQRQQVQVKNQFEPNRERQHEKGDKSCRSSGHQWGVQAQHWSEEGPGEPHRRGRVSTCQSNSDSCKPHAEFKLIGRCELREETQVSFTRSNFTPQPPFLSPPPPNSMNSRQEVLWSRGLQSLGAVTQLRVTVPFGGAASALGLKALAVWGQPAHCCPADEVQRIKTVHEANERLLPQPGLFTSSARQTRRPLQTAAPPRYVSFCLTSLLFKVKYSLL